ncbi:MAG: zf-HC2 domain-containing protein [Anaerolinea sp.]|nr:zf-HC2 domain-containing protein [Anaerolinea sp.]
MQPLTCRECRDLLPVYADGERRVSASLRRRIGAHLDRCPACDKVYRAHREIARELRSVTPSIGGSTRAPLSAIWSAVQAELAGSTARSADRLAVSLRYTAALVTLLIVILLPVLVGGGRWTLALPLPPTPIVVGDRAVTQPSLSVVAAIMTPGPMQSGLVSVDGAGPTPPQAPRYAPTTVATDEPR